MLSLLPASDPMSLSSPLSLSSLTLNKSSWASLSSSLKKTLLATSLRATSTAELFASLLAQLSTLPIKPLTPRMRDSDAAQSAILSRLLACIRESAAHPTETPESLNPLFLLAYLSLSEAQTALPPHLREEVTRIIADATRAGGEELERELRVLTMQLSALGECCRDEGEKGKECGCKSGGC